MNFNHRGDCSKVKKLDYAFLSENLFIMSSDKILFFVSFSITVFVIVMVMSFAFSKGGIIDTIQKEKRISELKHYVKELETLNEQKKRQIDMLKKNEEYRKSIVKGLGVEIEDNEYVFRFDKKEEKPLVEEKDNIKIITIAVIVIIMILLTIQLVVLTLLGIKTFSKQ